MIVLESSSKVTEIFDHLSYLPLATVQGLLKALQVHNRSYVFTHALSRFLVFIHFLKKYPAAAAESQHDLKRCLDTGSSQGHVFQVCVALFSQITGTFLCGQKQYN